MTQLSVVLPVYNEAEVLRELHLTLGEAIAGLRVTEPALRHEIVFVDDGSTDRSPAILDELATQDPAVRVLHFSRNFGHQAAVQAGLAHAAGDVVLLMDADMQDSPATLPALFAKWREGYDVVYAVRASRKENAAKRFLFAAFYRLLNAISQTPVPVDAGNFSLISAPVARAIAELPDRHRYLPGLRSWVGFKQAGIPVERGARYDASPRVSLLGLFSLAKTAVFSFSSFPLTIFYLIGAASIAVFLGLGTFTLYHKLFTGLAIPGWTSILVTTSFFGAVNALGIAILGEYILRIYDQVRGRPMYVVARKVGFEERKEAGSSFG